MTNRQTPTTSFVITCHDLGAYLPEALASVRGQTVQDFEVVIVNDGSTDGPTCRLLSELQDSGSQIVHSEQKGLPGARNLGARHAQGRYLCMLDADDLLEPTYLERSLGELETRPDIAFASHWLRAFGDEEWEWTPEDCGFPALLHANTINGAALVRREIFERVGGFDESMTDGCEDWEFWIRVVESGHVGTIVPEFLFRYRRRADSMSRLMHAVPGGAALYRQLIDRQPDLFARHLIWLVERRDQEIASLSVSLWHAETEWTADLEGRQRWQQDNALTRQREQALAQAVAEARHLHAEFNREAELNEALRRSWSWRLTAPLRALVGWVRP